MNLFDIICSWIGVCPSLSCFLPNSGIKYNINTYNICARTPVHVCIKHTYEDLNLVHVYWCIYWCGCMSKDSIGSARIRVMSRLHSTPSGTKPTEVTPSLCADRSILEGCELWRCCLEARRPISLKNVTVILCADSRTSLPTETSKTKIDKDSTTFIFLLQLIFFCTVRLKSTRLGRLFSRAPTRRSSAAASCAWLNLSGKLWVNSSTDPERRRDAPCCAFSVRRSTVK